MSFKHAADIALLLFCVNIVIFTLVYSIRSPWWKNQIGRIYVSKSILLSLVVVQIVAAIWISDSYFGRQPIRFLIYTAGAAGYVPMIISLWKRQNIDRGLTPYYSPLHWIRDKHQEFKSKRKAQDRKETDA